MTLERLVRFTCLLVLLFCVTFASAQNRMPYYDGPYIFDQGDSLLIQWVIKGYAHDTLIHKTEAGLWHTDSLPSINLADLAYDTPEQATYTGVSKILAISDVHGQYDIFTTLLQEHGVVDEDLRWSYKKGHLVIVGDNFDRGDRVMDILWLLFRLQKEAIEAGGQVHVLLGNHEVMVLNNDLRYLHRKYLYSSALFRTRYDQFFRASSILGDWLSSHPVMVSINDHLFVHGGISTSLLGLDYTLEDINKTYRDHLIRKVNGPEITTPDEDILYYDDGPLWYRGYFDTAAIAIEVVDQILDSLGQDAIVVGHTSLQEITSLYDGKVLGIDCSIKLGKTGQALIIKGKRHYVGDIKGKRQRLRGPYDKGMVSLFQYISGQGDVPEIIIDTDIHHLIKEGDREEYQPARLQLITDSKIQTLQGRARARGHIRKQVCRFPPVKFDFSKSYLDSVGFVDNDKLKFVFPCSGSKDSQKKLLKEYFLYGLYEVFDSNAIKAQLVNVKITHSDEEKHHFTGFLIEDEQEYASRKNAIVIEKGVIRDNGLDRPSFLKMLFFQYMIANTDWAISSRHNVEFVKLPNKRKVVALPYDFDYSGFVGQLYAVPHESLPITDVKDRYFMPYKIKEQEYYGMVRYMLSQEKKVYQYCEDASYLDSSIIKSTKKYFKTFFDLLRHPDRLKDDIIK